MITTNTPAARVYEVVYARGVAHIKGLDEQVRGSADGLDYAYSACSALTTNRAGWSVALRTEDLAAALEHAAVMVRAGQVPGVCKKCAKAAQAALMDVQHGLAMAEGNEQDWRARYAKDTPELLGRMLVVHLRESNREDLYVRLITEELYGRALVEADERFWRDMYAQHTSETLGRDLVFHLGRRVRGFMVSERQDWHIQLLRDELHGRALVEFLAASGTWFQAWEAKDGSSVWEFRTDLEVFEGHYAEVSGHGPFTWTVGDAFPGGAVRSTGEAPTLESAELAAVRALASVK